MNNFNLIIMSFKKNSFKFVFVLLLTITITTCYSSFLIIRAIAKEDSESLIENRNSEQKSEPPPAPIGRESSSILETLWKLLRAKREQEPALSSRSNICEITPGLLGETNLIYSDRPLFLWQGKVPQLEIYLYTPFSLEKEQEVLWSQRVASNSDSIFYSGEPLQPGQIYDWEIVVDAAANRRRISFQVMDTAERDRISGELAQLETELTTSGASKEEIILAKSNYFAQRDLWSDALQQLSSLEEFSNVAKDNNQKIVSYICQSDSL